MNEQYRRTCLQLTCTTISNSKERTLISSSLNIFTAMLPCEDLNAPSQPFFSVGYVYMGRNKRKYFKNYLKVDFLLAQLLQVSNQDY